MTPSLRASAHMQRLRLASTAHDVSVEMQPLLLLHARPKSLCAQSRALLPHPEEQAKDDDGERYQNNMNIAGRALHFGRTEAEGNANDREPKSHPCYRGAPCYGGGEKRQADDCFPDPGLPDGNRKVQFRKA